MSSNMNPNYSRGFKEVKSTLSKTLYSLSSNQLKESLRKISDSSIPSGISEKAKQSLTARRVPSGTKREQIQVAVVLVAATKTVSHAYLDLEIKIAREEIWKTIFSTDESVLREQHARGITCR